VQDIAPYRQFHINKCLKRPECKSVIMISPTSLYLGPVPPLTFLVIILVIPL
jgi:hypothetical protein